MLGWGALGVGGQLSGRPYSTAPTEIIISKVVTG